ncbi:MAG: hypothetical protein IJZ00_01475 [Lachnospiraceae bacterium]|nr:hypothetical protein [Lachnospiraceae bacterium]
MDKNLSYILIETTIRNTIKKIKEDPERNVRNLVDLALFFSEGRFQRRFFQTAQTMLKNENSSYYKLIPDIITNVNTERIVSFGMNVGYNSCTIGANTIREIEASEHFNIPWCITLDLDGNDYRRNPSVYHSLISQGKELGIYVWIIHSLRNPHYMIDLMCRFPDCAFLLLCTPDEITPALLKNCETVYNIMFAVKYKDSADSACALLRSGNHLYSVYSDGMDSNENNLNELLCDTENLHASFTFILSDPKDNFSLSDIHHTILQARAEQNHCTIPFALLQDSYFIDSIISEYADFLLFDVNGNCYSLNNNTLFKNCNFKHDSLRDILKRIPHHTQQEIP